MAFLNPQKVVEELGITPGMIVADFGAGSGHFSIEAAKLVGQSGKVYSIDIQKQALEAVRSKAKSGHLSNLQTIWADLETPGASKLKGGLVDLVIISNILFQAEDKNQIVQEAKRVLKPKGQAAVIEWLDKIPKSEIENILLRDFI
jgi:ubiquinone/menaquinone biosynthesis C-methylase UbiE